MTSLKNALLKAGEYDVGFELCRPKDVEQMHFVKGYNRGMQDQHARLRPLLQACAEVVEAAEDLRRLTQDICVDYTVEEGVFDNALASLRERLGVKDE
jgi:hypothetical protein